jgi:superfamily I DNA and/or RNA helicase
VLARTRFPCVLIDEATQATEAATLVPLCRGAQQLVLLGDQCQASSKYSHSKYYTHSKYTHGK